MFVESIITVALVVKNDKVRTSRAFKAVTQAEEGALRLGREFNLHPGVKPPGKEDEFLKVHPRRRAPLLGMIKPNSYGGVTLNPCS